MNTTSTFSAETSLKTGLYIKSDFKLYKYGKNNNVVNPGVTKEKAVVKHIFQTPAANQGIAGNHTYTIRQGDDKRLSKDGVLRVYNIMETINIPVRSLLGNWKKSHIGVTLIVTNGQWCIEGEEVEYCIPSEKGVLIALRLLLRFALA